jgi:phage terminase large subunit
MIAVELTAMDQYRVSIKKRVFNEKFYPYMDCQTPEQHFFGGGGSGKSVFIADRTILDLCKTNRNFLVIRKVADTLRTSFFAEMKKARSKFKLDGYVSSRETDMEMTGPNGSKILFRGLDNAEKIKSITVPNGVITDIIIEEATELSESDYNMLITRLRGRCKYVKRVTLLYNTIYRTHWICKRFFKGQNLKYYHDDKVLLLHSTYKDNKFLDQQDRDRLESFKETSPYHYMVYALGEWGVLGDLIFTKWETMDIEGLRNNFDLWRCGLDFGFTNDPTVLLSTAYSKRDKTIYIFDEIYARGLQNPDLARMAKPICKSTRIIADSEAPKDIAELKSQDKYSLNVEGAEKPKGMKLHTIQWLQQHRIVINEKCIKTIEEMSTYQWKKNKAGESINEAVEINDHAMDALRYAYSKDVQQGDYFSWS